MRPIVYIICTGAVEDQDHLRNLPEYLPGGGDPGIMDASQLPALDGLLVTAGNPARADLSGMDYVRCAALHNYLVRYAWVSEGRELADLDSNNTYFTTHGAETEVLRPRLHPSLAAFLSAAIVPPANDPESPPFFIYVSGFSDPPGLFDNQTADLFDEPEDSLVFLYTPNIGQGGSSGGGLFYHQGIHRCAVFMHMDDHDFAFPVAAHSSLWHPFETVLSNWIELIQLGKIMASPRDTPALYGGEKIGPWEWRPYGEAQVAACVSAWDRLCDVIEARVSSLNSDTADPKPLLSSSALDAASVPEPSFAHAFLSRARRPRFRYIAPGLMLPSADASAFVASQPFTRLPRGAQAVPPVCLFPAVGSPLADVAGWSSPFCHDFRTTFADSHAPSRVPAGVYSESVEREFLDSAEEGFRLLLPYGLEGDVWNEGAGARKSDGSSVRGKTATELFQHGYKPFGGDYYRPQRLERLFDHWRKLVDEGVWSVGLQGIEGTIDTFKQADTAGWRDYVISPTW